MCEAKSGVVRSASWATRRAAVGKGAPAARGLSRRVLFCNTDHSLDRRIRRSSCSCLPVPSVSRRLP
eukprot:5970800-Pyramimonas_sp.AAC.1